MKQYETDKELMAALEKLLGKKLEKSQFIESKGDLHSAYSAADFREILNAIQNKEISLGEINDKALKSPYGKIPSVIQSISDEVALWEELLLYNIEPQLSIARIRLLGTPQTLDPKQAMEFLEGFFKKDKLNIRLAYVDLFFERYISPRDYNMYLENMKPNDEEYFLTMVALIMNRAYMSGNEAIHYLITGQRILIPGIFNPTNILVMYRLVLYLQPSGQPSRSLLSMKEKTLVRFVGLTTGKPGPEKLRIEWNHQYPDWSYDNWRFYWKAYKRAYERLVRNFDMAFLYEQMRETDSQKFWQWLEDIMEQVKGT